MPAEIAVRKSVIDDRTSKALWLLAEHEHLMKRMTRFMGATATDDVLSLVRSEALRGMVAPLVTILPTDYEPKK